MLMVNMGFNEKAFHPVKATEISWFAIQWVRKLAIYPEITEYFYNIEWGLYAWFNLIIGLM